MIEIDVGDIHRARRKLETIASKGLPYAARQALNDVAFAAREEWQGQMRSTLTVRSKWTERSVQVDRARGLDVRGMRAIVGSVQPYMRTQEEGGAIASSGKHGVAIPTSVASGEGRSKRPRKRLVRRRSWLSAIQLPQGRGGKTRQQRNAVAVQQALNTGARVAFLDLGDRKGIVRVSGAKRRPRIQWLWDLSRRSVTVPARPTLEPALAAVRPRGVALAQRALERQIEYALRGRGR